MFRPSSMAATIVAKLSSSRTRSATSPLTSLPRRPIAPPAPPPPAPPAPAPRPPRVGPLGPRRIPEQHEPEPVEALLDLAPPPGQRQHAQAARRRSLRARGPLAAGLVRELAAG